MKRPPPLAAGARVALVCPSGPLAGPDDLDRAEANCRALGWEPVPGAAVLARDGYLAGTDQQRLDDFNAALRDDSIDGIWCVRGGYGAMRLLEGIEYDVLRRHPSALMGYSDITALHAAIGMRCDLVTYHAPVARVELTPFTRDSLERAVVQRADPCGRRRRRGRCAEEGRRGGVVGGKPRLAGGAVRHRVRARLRRCDRRARGRERGRVPRGAHAAHAAAGRRLRDLHRARVRGLHQHAGSNAPTDGGSRPLDAVLQEVADLLRVPCVSGVPVGHIDDQWTIPLGAHAHLDADDAHACRSS